MNALPLAHRRVVITRAADQTELLSRRLRELGAEPISLPLIEIAEASDGGAALRAALTRLSTFDWLVVTSPNGALRVNDAVAGLGEGRPRIATIGTATAAVFGEPVDLTPRHQIAEGLLAEFPAGSGAVLLTQAEVALPNLAEGLAELGWHVEVVAAYRTTTCTPTSSQRAEALTADAVLFASGSAVQAWVDAFGSATSPTVIAIGPATAEVAHRLELKVDAIAADHSVDGLVKCLMAYFLEHS